MADYDVITVDEAIKRLCTDEGWLARYDPGALQDQGNGMVTWPLAVSDEARRLHAAYLERQQEYRKRAGS